MQILVTRPRRAYLLNTTIELIGQDATRGVDTAVADPVNNAAQIADSGRSASAMLCPMARSRDGVEIAYETHGRTDGDAPAVVLIHGWAGNRTFWSRQVDLLAETYQVVALDLGGHGESGVGRDDWNLPAFGDDVVAVVEEVGAGDVALVGHSMGGDAAVFAARLLGDRVRGVVWVDTFRSLGDEPTSSAEDVAQFVAPFHVDFGAAVDRFARSLFPEEADPALVDHVARSMVAAPREASLGSIGHALNRHPPIIAVLAELSAPVVAMNPDVSPTDAESMRGHGVEPIILTGVGHFSMLEDPDQFNPLLAATLTSFFG
ncbi:MAG: alpha/beta fold hydrolase [Acidimicrobiales bacterium]